ncbi:MAG: hypothetical protein AMXMBFR13_04940 [Phycisphaerae bacterium]
MGIAPDPAIAAREARLRLQTAAVRAELTNGWGDWIRRHPGQALLGALAAGFIVGAAPRTVQALCEGCMSAMGAAGLAAPVRHSPSAARVSPVGCPPVV